MIGKWKDGSKDFLGHDFIGDCPPVVIVGTDQSEADWGTMLSAVGLIQDDGTILPPIRIWTAADPLHFNEKGFEALSAELEKHDSPLLIVDSYHSCVSPLGQEDSGSTYANPLAALLTVTAKARATTCVIHHAQQRCRCKYRYQFAWHHCIDCYSVSAHPHELSAVGEQEEQRGSP